MNRVYLKCGCCGRYHKAKVIPDRDAGLCPRCGARYSRCSICGGYYPLTDGGSRKERCACATEKSIRRDYFFNRFAERYISAAAVRRMGKR